MLATHNLDEADRLCDRVAFVRGGLLRVDSPAGLRAATGIRGVDVALAGPTEALAAVARTVAGVSGATTTGLHLAVAADDPATVTPDLVRALVAAGAAITEVRERGATLEDVYFEIMGVRPGAGGEVE